mmetsp:Transcript_91826/g.210380  ORF Transcript_91826/g.210380 Transcript_91826/m.210380 type:complete len:127 (+) Transcript_91826:1-381(+)
MGPRGKTTGLVPAMSRFQPAYRDFVRAVRKAFGPDVATAAMIVDGTKGIMRRAGLDEEAKIRELAAGKEFVQVGVVQAYWNEPTGTYRALVTEEHVQSGRVLDLRERPDPEEINTPLGETYKVPRS